MTTMRTRTLSTAALALALLVGCDKGNKQPDFPDLSPVKGGVKRDGQPVKGGVVQFTPDPDKPEFLINSEVGADGVYTLSTVRTTDSKGERKTGAPAGTAESASARPRWTPPTPARCARRARPRP